MQQFGVQARLEGVRHIGADSVSGPDLGDEVGSFVDAHGQALIRFAFLLTSGNGPQAEDLVQTVLARLVARGLAGLDDPVAYARRGIVNEHTSAGRHSQVHQRTIPQLVTPQTTTESAARTEDRLTVLTALDALSDRERAAVVLRYYEDLPDTEIATVLACSRPTVRSLIHRAIPKLKAQLGDTYGTGPSDRPARTARPDLTGSSGRPDRSAHHE